MPLPLIITHAINGLLMISMPVGLAIFLRRRFGHGWGLIGIGAATFVLSQVGHIPFNALLTYLFNQGVLPTPPQIWRMPFNAVVLGLSAGLWEECARYATYRWWAKSARKWQDAIMLGVGHGGIEAILLGLLVLVGYVNMIVLRTTDVSTLIPADQLAALQAQVQTYWSADWYYTLLGALERALTIPFHIAASVLVWQVFRRGQIRWLWFSIGWHAALNAIALLLNQRVNAYAAEGFLALALLVNLWVIFHFREPATKDDEPVPAPTRDEPPKAILPTNEPEITSDSIEKTRYQ